MSPEIHLRSLGTPVAFSPQGLDFREHSNVDAVFAMNEKELHVRDSAHLCQQVGRSLTESASVKTSSPSPAHFPPTWTIKGASESSMENSMSVLPRHVSQPLDELVGVIFAFGGHR